MITSTEQTCDKAAVELHGSVNLSALLRTTHTKITSFVVLIQITSTNICARAHANFFSFPRRFSVGASVELFVCLTFIVPPRLPPPTPATPTPTVPPSAHTSATAAFQHCYCCCCCCCCYCVRRCLMGLGYCEKTDALSSSPVYRCVCVRFSVRWREVRRVWSDRDGFVTFRSSVARV